MEDKDKQRYLIFGVAAAIVIFLAVMQSRGGSSGSGSGLTAQQVIDQNNAANDRTLQAQLAAANLSVSFSEQLAADNLALKEAQLNGADTITLAQIQAASAHDLATIQAGVSTTQATDALKIARAEANAQASIATTNANAAKSMNNTNQQYGLLGGVLSFFGL